MINSLVFNKKGSINVGIFVILVIFIYITALYSFTQNTRTIEKKLNGVGFLGEVYTKESSIDSYLKYFGEKAVIESYNDFAVSGDYSGVVITDDGGYVTFSSIRGDFDKKFEEKVSTKFKERLVETDFKDSILIGFKEFSLQNTVVGSFNEGEIITFSVKGFVYGGDATNVDKGVNVNINAGFDETSVLSPSSSANPDFAFKYSPTFERKINLNEIGLNGFEEIYSANNACTASIPEEKKNCMSGLLKHFNVDVSQDWKITLTSKKKFIINGEFSPVILKIK
jgi:hypothetical protein